MKIYIASSWKNEHAVVMLTELLRARGHDVKSFIENQHGEQAAGQALHDGKPMPFDEWCHSERGTKSFAFDTHWATHADLVIYLGPSGKDAAAEVGAAWSRGVCVLGLWAKGEDFGLMRRMIEWQKDVRELLATVDSIAGDTISTPTAPEVHHG